MESQALASPWQLDAEAVSCRSEAAARSWQCLRRGATNVQAQCQAGEAIRRSAAIMGHATAEHNTLTITVSPEALPRK